MERFFRYAPAALIARHSRFTLSGVMKPKLDLPVIRFLALIAVLSLGLAACGDRDIKDAREFIERGDYQAALTRISLYVQKEPDSAEGQLVYGTVLAHLGRDKDADEAFRKALASDGGLKAKAGQAWFAAAKTQTGGKKTSLVEEYLRKAAAVDPSLANEMARWAISQADAQFAELPPPLRPLKLLETAAALDKSLGKEIAGVCEKAILAYKSRDRLLETIGLINRCAFPHAEHIASLETIIEEIAVGQFRMGYVDDAAQILSTASDKTPGIASKESYAYIVKVAGNAQAGAPELTDFVTRFPQSQFTPWALMRLADLAVSEGKQEEARGFYQRIINEFPNFPKVLDVRAKLGELDSIFLVDNFDSASLNKTLWTEVVATDVGMDGHFAKHGVREGAYYLSQTDKKDVGTAIMSNRTFGAGYTLTAGIEVVAADGTWNVGFGVNIPAKSPQKEVLGLWGGVTKGGGSLPGKYKLVVDFREDGYDMRVFREGSTVAAMQQTHPAKPPYYFSLAGRTGEDGTLTIKFDNIQIKKTAAGK
ncbi:MAG: hypothetical protein GMKNLPBB_03264 [Myxococcota bacterium]|nr:hypothetical protein [Myxococcota bacterium]